jgi:hypothetical protein
MNGC